VIYCCHGYMHTSEHGSDRVRLDMPMDMIVTDREP